ncbi:Heterokaryon incompatibility protein (HET) domain containing protein [Hyaloscypha variabilis]
MSLWFIPHTQPDMTSPDHYRYSPLPSPTSFRSLVLYPRASDNTHSPLCGKLQAHDQPPSKVSFETLSYVWGSGDLTHTIALDDKLLPITANLYSALIALRLEERPTGRGFLGCDLPSEPPQWGHRIIWADGICINQADALEKGKQVSQMGQYYQDAARTIVYLGEEAEGSDLAKALLEEICINAKDQGSANLPERADPAWRAVDALFLRPWWTRYWIIQELVKSSQVLVVCGSWSLHWDMFAKAVRWAAEHNLLGSFVGNDIDKMESSKQGQRALANLVVMRDTMRQHRSASTWTLIDLLERNRMARCTNERDYIYALLGLSIEGNDDSMKDHLTVDYSEAVEDCYTRFTKCMIKWGDGIKVLYSACYNGGRKGLPTWVPNWASADLPWRTLAPKFDLGPDPWYCAGTRAQASLKLTSVSKHLVLRGVMVDTIKTVGRVASRERQPNEIDTEGVMSRDLNVVASAASDLEYFLNINEPPKGKPTRDSIWRVLCCDLDLTTNVDRAPPALGSLLQPTLSIAKNWSNILAGRTPTSFELSSKESNHFIMRTAPMCLGRRPMITDSVWMGMVPNQAEVGDVVFLPLGSAVPFVLREEVNGFKLVGECFVHGIMGGELLVEGAKFEDISLL